MVLTQTASPAELSFSVIAASTLEELARPLLRLLHLATGLESTYLTSIDLMASEQHVQFALNKGDMQIPEGLTVPWADTLCKRALDEGRAVCQDVADIWGDSDAARALGIKTYASAPIRTSDGVLVGTLCAASAGAAELSDWARGTLNMLAKIVAQHIERERLIEQLKAANDELKVQALTDALTGLPNRRAVIEVLERMLARYARDGTPVLVGMIDLDGFKSINDKLGHLAGDRFLKEIGHRLKAALRPTDVVGRIGGDEFAVIGLGTQSDADELELAKTLQDRLATATAGQYSLGDVELNYDGASVGVVVVSGGVDAEAALRGADAEMFLVKGRRKLGVCH